MTPQYGEFLHVFNILKIFLNVNLSIPKIIFMFACKHKPVFMCINIKFVFVFGPNIYFVSLNKPGLWLAILWRKGRAWWQEVGQGVFPDANLLSE